VPSDLGAAHPQARHLTRLRLARVHPDTFDGPADLLGKLIGDLRRILMTDPGTVVVSSPADAIRHQESYARRFGIPTRFTIQGIEYVLIPPATVRTAGGSQRFPSLQDDSRALYVSHRALPSVDRLAVAPTVSVKRLSDLDAWMAAIHDEVRGYRLPAPDELRHAVRMGLIAPTDFASQEVCAEHGELFLIQWGSGADGLTCSEHRISNRNMSVAPDTCWRLAFTV
jgi:hypothetical protein